MRTLWREIALPARNGAERLNLHNTFRLFAAYNFPYIQNNSNHLGYMVIAAYLSPFFVIYLILILHFCFWFLPSLYGDNHNNILLRDYYLPRCW